MGSIKFWTQLHASTNKLTNKLKVKFEGLHHCLNTASTNKLTKKMKIGTRDIEAALEESLAMFEQEIFTKGVLPDEDIEKALKSSLENVYLIFTD